MEDGCFWSITISVRNYLFPVLVVNYWRDAGKMRKRFLSLASDVRLLLCNLLWLDNALVKIHDWLRVVHTHRKADSLNAGNREL